MEGKSDITGKCTGNFVKYGRAILDICRRTDKHTETVIAIIAPISGAK